MISSRKFWHSSTLMIKTTLFLLLVSLTCLAQEIGLPLYYWQAASYVNFGDFLSFKLVERMVGGHLEAVCKKNGLEGRKKMLAIGSVMTMAREMDVIWGSGVKCDTLDPARYQFTHLDIRAVRGPKTRRYLQETLGVACPEVYGDPALLLPYFFPEFKKKRDPTYDYIVIPHYSELADFVGTSNVVSSIEPWDYVIDKILDSKLVIATSLHGIIVAEAFGIPARLLRVSDNQPLFKYQDYYEGTGRPNFQYATTVEEAIAMGGEEPFSCDLKKLYETFPFDYWPEAPRIEIS